LNFHPEHLSLISVTPSWEILRNNAPSRHCHIPADQSANSLSRKADCTNERENRFKNLFDGREGIRR
jgi:hypothetical protein